MKHFLIVLILLISQFNSKSQDVKFSDLNYNVIYVDSLENLVDTISFSFKINCTNKDEINQSINYLNWNYGCITDSVLISVDSRLQIRVEDNEYNFGPSNISSSRISLNKDRIVFKVGLRDLELPFIQYVFFSIDYKKKYHCKYHDKPDIYLGEMPLSWVEKNFNENEIKFLYK